MLTLGDVLFTTGRADLKPGALADVDRLVAFLNKYPDRTVTIEGHTDSVGSAASNETLSQNRADAVQSYLMQRGIERAASRPGAWARASRRIQRHTGVAAESAR